MPTIFDWINRFEFMRGWPSVLLVLGLAVVIVTAWDWRLSLLALLVQYLAAGLLFIDVLEPRLAVVKLLAGLFVCLILYVTARQVGYGRVPPDVMPEEAAMLAGNRQFRVGAYTVPTTWPFRLMAALFVGLLGWALAQQPSLQLPVFAETAGYLHTAVYGLVGLGLLSMILTADPWSAGLGMLLFLTGFELFFSALEQSVTMLALMAGGTLLITLLIAYLVQARRRTLLS
jgi:hypothetical protein